MVSVEIDWAGAVLPESHPRCILWIIVVNSSETFCRYSLM